MSDSNVAVALKTVGAGWVDCQLRFGSENFRLEWLSDTTDVLGDLVRLALVLATGAWTARASFDGEPVETRLIAGAVWDRERMAWREGFYIRVLTFRDIFANESDEAGDIVLDVKCDSRDFINAVLAEAKRIWVEKDDKYSWGSFQFPLRALRALESALATEDPPPVFVAP